MAEQGIPMFGTLIHERDAYRALFTYGGTLTQLGETQTRNLPAALKNAHDFVAEVVSMLAPARTRKVA
jgi:chromosome partitioning protein